MAQHSIPVPHEQREQITSPLAFKYRMAEHGFTVMQTSKVYTDPAVFRQQWLVCPNGTSYPDHAFYRLFGSTHFRKLLRYILPRLPCLRTTLEDICPRNDLLTIYLTFLLDQGWLYQSGRCLERGGYQMHILNIGKTLEWYVAEWFRLTYTISHLVPVRHGVHLAELPLPGDLDVVACLDENRIVMVECKSSNDVDEAHCLRFLQRVEAFHPTLAILLIDTAAPFSAERIATFNATFRALGYPLLRGARGFYRGALDVYIVNVEHSIEISLRDVLQFHQLHTSTW